MSWTDPSSQVGGPDAGGRREIFHAIPASYLL
jgi:hypothetical protein